MLEQGKQPTNPRLLCCLSISFIFRLLLKSKQMHLQSQTQLSHPWDDQAVKSEYDASTLTSQNLPTVTSPTSTIKPIDQL